MIKLFLFIALMFTQSFGVTCDGYGDFIQHNGHYYTVTKNRLKFSDAKTLAEGSNGYLAIPDDAAENTFLKGLIGGGDFAWIGVEDPSFSDSYCYGAPCVIAPNRFKTVKLATPTFTNWASGQPDNFVYNYDVYHGTQMVLPLGESWAAMRFTGEWQDDGNHASDNNNPVKHVALFEFDTKPQCYNDPSTVTDQIAGTKCNTQIYDTTTGVISDGLAYDCQKDQYGHDYCPAALAACGESWTYQDGYSVAVGATISDYTSKILTNVTTVTGYTISNSTVTVASNGVSFGLYKVAGGFQFCLQGTNNCGAVTSFDLNEKLVRASLAFSFGPYGLTLNGSAPSGNMQMLSCSGAISPIFQKSGTGISNNAQISSGCPVYQFGLIKNGAGFYITTIGGTNGQTITWEPMLSTVQQLTCPTGYTATTGAETANGECKKSVNYTYYNYLCSTGTATNTGGNCNKTDPSGTVDNTATLSTACNSSTPPTNNCASQLFTCVAAPDRPCSYVNNSWQCSPFPCFGGSDLENADAPVGINDANNDGWNNDGNCMGQLYIFNGKDNRCRSDDAFFGLTGGGCCDKDKVGFGLIQCKPEEEKLAKLNRNRQCHYVGDYCSKKLKLGFIKICIQHSQSHCCYNGKLARIINEQGRVQLGKSYGSPESPDCKGFTPDEFQKLDFSEIDMSEFFADLQAQMSTSMMSNTGTFIQNKVSNILNQ